MTHGPSRAGGAALGGQAHLDVNAGERELDRPLEELVNRRPVSCHPDTPLRWALEKMRAERIGSIVVVDAQEHPVGVLTLGDVLVRVALPQTALDSPVAAVMSPGPFCLAARAPAFEAALLMARENIRHVPLVSDGRLVGVVSESRLFALWRRSIGAARAAIVQAGDVGAVIAAAAGIRELPLHLLRQGLSGDAVTALLTSLNDMLVERLLELTGTAQALGELGGCWLALGSQGRMEQTLATDQDNAILFHDDADADACRRRLLPLALTVNEALDRCGFALCHGGIMASNPLWCLSLSEWKARFGAWIDQPDPLALLNAAIFFDFRALRGSHPLVSELRRWLAGHAQSNDRFLMLMVMNALQNPPPLGVVRDFVLTRGGEHPGTIDLKTNGVQPFVEAARIFALSRGVTASNTIERLEAAGRARAIPEQETSAWCDAFRSIQGLRLRLNAQQRAQGAQLHNFLDPASLNNLDRKMLRESLRQARSLQSRLTRDFSLAGTAVRT